MEFLEEENTEQKYQAANLARSENQEKTALLIMRLSGGLIRTTEQAKLIMLISSICLISLSIYFFLFGGKPKHVDNPQTHSLIPKNR